MKYDLFWPYVPPEARAAVDDVLRSRFIGQGPKVDLFEREFEKKFGIKHKNAVSVNSCTSALEIAYDLIGLKPGDEVISTPLTCNATNIPLIRRGVKIVWADINRDTLCISATDVLSKVTKKTKAIVQVHLGGIQADVTMPGWDIPIVSDAAQALGFFNGNFTCCSFQSIKQITTGDGGMLVVDTKDSERDRNRAKLLRWFGIDREKKIRNNWQAYLERKPTFDIQLPGYKYQMTDISAAMGLAGLARYDGVIAHRKKIFDIYRKRLHMQGSIRLIDGTPNTYWLATLLVEDRDSFAKAMFEADIDTNLVQVRNDVYKVFGGKKADLKTLAEVEDKYISIPIGMHISEDDAHYICDRIMEGW